MSWTLLGMLPAAHCKTEEALFMPRLRAIGVTLPDPRTTTRQA